MVRYPGARWDPLGPQTEPRMRSHDIACIHTMVGSLAGTSSMFHENGYGGTESHFGLGGAGEMVQWQDIGFQADANFDGNDRVISLETADKGPGFGAWSGSDVPAWTAAQVDAIVAWLLWVTSKEAHADCPPNWLCRLHGIPRVLVPDTGLTRRGIAVHRQGVESYPNPYEPGWLQPGCEKWSASRGKVCPGDRRIHQLQTVIIPRLHAPSLPEDSMAIIFDTEDEFVAAVGRAIDQRFTQTGTGTRSGLIDLLTSTIAAPSHKLGQAVRSAVRDGIDADAFVDDLAVDLFERLAPMQAGTLTADVVRTEMRAALANVHAAAAAAAVDG